MCGWGRRSVHSEETSLDPESDRSWSCVRTVTYRRHNTSQSLSHTSTLITCLVFCLADALFGLSLCNIICSMEFNEEAERPETFSSLVLRLLKKLISGWVLQHRCTVRYPITQRHPTILCVGIKVLLEVHLFIGFSFSKEKLPNDYTPTTKQPSALFFPSWSLWLINWYRCEYKTEDAPPRVCCRSCRWRRES